MEKRPIVIMAAMDVEMDYLKEKLQDINEVKVGKYIFYEGTIHNYPVVICWCHVMSYNAAVASYIAIDKYNPIAIISQGTAGAHSKNIHTGDIVLGEKCVNIVSTKTPYKKEGEGSNSLEWPLKCFFCAEDERREIHLCDEKLLNIAKQISNTHGDVKIGVLGSGDVWNNEFDRILYLNQNYGTLCEDMESNAIYCVARDFNVHVLGIRIISNNELIGEPYDRNTGLYSQEFVYKFILKLIEEQ